MNLRDYIGDTRTDSLPPGFLKSIKIKYKHEASHVFAGLQPLLNEKVTHRASAIEESSRSKDGSREGDGKDGVGEQNAPSFMSWRVPSRLLNQKCEKTLPISEETDKNFKAKSASSISRRTTAPTVRSLTSTALKRSKKNAEQKISEPKLENTSQMKEKDLKINTSEINSGKSSNRIQSGKIEEKQREENDVNVKSANKILKPITLKLDKDHGSTFKEKDNIPKKTVKQSRENFQKLKEEEAGVARYDIKMNKRGSLRSQENIPSKNPEVATSPKEKSSNTNAGIKVDDTKRATSGDGNRKMSAKDSGRIDAKRLSNRSLKNVNDIQELPKMKGLLPERIQNNPQKNNAVLPMLKATESRTSIKLSHTPERMDKIFDWVKKSTRREREAAFNLLSAYNNSENIEAKTPQKKERVRIALQVLERRRIPDSIKPFQLSAIKPNPTVMKLDQKALEGYSSHVSKREKEGIQTWHHVPMYHHIDSSNNKSAMFVQPSKPYQRHFSIHPEWGLHTHVKFANTITT